MELCRIQVVTLRMINPVLSFTDLPAHNDMQIRSRAVYEHLDPGNLGNR